ncbi:hypothetical protein, partial [Georgenia sp. MJ170]|uniref:hypothetical protein n=1 Tax=Georgenia sunbinii TaxID=3117728 RepID=UPI002F260B4F
MRRPTQTIGSNDHVKGNGRRRRWAVLSTMVLGFGGLLTATVPAAQAADEIPLPMPGAWSATHPNIVPQGQFTLPASGTTGVVPAPPSGEPYLYVTSTPDPDTSGRWQANVNVSQVVPLIAGAQYNLMWQQVATTGSRWQSTVHVANQPLVTPDSSDDWSTAVTQFVADSNTPLTFNYRVGDPTGSSEIPVTGALADIMIVPAEPTIAGPQDVIVGAGESQTFEYPVTNTWGCALDGASALASVALSEDRSTCVLTVAPSHADVGSLTFDVAAQNITLVSRATTTVDLTVTTTPDRIELSPSPHTIAAGESVTYQAQAYDAGDFPLGDVTADTEFTVDGDASCDAEVCTSTTAGEYTVTGTYDGMVATGDLTVTPAAADHLVLSPPT